MSTMKDVAKAAGVSVATVSRVLNEDTRVTAQTREKVLRVIRDLRYTPNTLGRNLRMQTTRRVLVLVSSLSNQFCSGVVRGMEGKAAENGYQVMLAATHQNPELEYQFVKSLEKPQCGWHGAHGYTIARRQAHRYCPAVSAGTVL